MTRCGTCGYVTPGAGRFCEGCGRSFKMKYCPSKHASSGAAKYCGICGSDKLSASTKAKHLNLSSPLVRMLVSIFTTKLLFPFTLPLVIFALWIANILFKFTFGSSLNSLFNWVSELFILWLIGWIVLRLCAGNQSDIPKAYLNISKHLFKYGSRLSAQVAKVLWRYLFGKSNAGKEEKIK